MEVDLELHQQALGSALSMKPGPDRDASLTQALAEQACLLEDEPYSDWALRPRESLERARQEARLALARDRSAGAGRSGHGFVVQAWEDYLIHEPASEEGAAALMRIYAAQGQRHLVVRTYQRCRFGLADLGLDSSPALEKIYAGSNLEAGRRSLASSEPASNLPSSFSSFIGREPEQAEVRSLIESSRLVTLTGAGGSGKTRLALSVAAALLDGSYEGVFFVDLAPIAEPDQVPGTVAAALGIYEQAGRPLLEVLVEVLGDQHVLLVVDNCEHVVETCARLAERLIRVCPRTHLLATSREALRIDAEQLYRVPPLSLPGEEAGLVLDLEGSDAVELFVERARPGTPPSYSTNRPPLWWPPFADGSTACPLLSSSLLPGWPRCRSPSCTGGSTSASSSSPEGFAPSCLASRRYWPPLTGPLSY